MLPYECLENIILNLEYDIYSLHSCLLVNKAWCVISVSILWRWTFINTHRGEFDSPFLVPSYFPFLSEESRSLIGIKLISSKSGDGGDNIGDNGGNIQFNKPLFNYPLYLRGFSCDKLIRMSAVWVSSLSNSSNMTDNTGYYQRIVLGQDNQNLMIVVAKELYKLFLNQSKCLERLDIDTLGFTDDICIYYDDPATDALIDLIKSQKNLKKFTISQGVQLSRVLESLESQSDSLKFLKLNICNLDNTDEKLLKGVAQCKNLEQLKFHACRELTSSLLKPLVVNSKDALNKLKVLDFFSSIPPEYELSSIVINSSKSLRELSYDGVGNLERYPHMIDIIADNCPNLVKLNIKATQKPLPQLSNLFKKCKKLQIVRIKGRPNSGDRVDNELLPRLAEFTPLSLKKFELTTFCAFSFDSTQKFLKNCNSHIQEITLRCLGDHNLYLDAFKKYGKEKGMAFKSHHIAPLRYDAKDIKIVFSPDFSHDHIVWHK
ncbi:13863_t:CDS:2 [Entrophospora sp. SA101]|nr:13863_t:CDS:2 [Entrophospora sp. SA101]